MFYTTFTIISLNLYYIKYENKNNGNTINMDPKIQEEKNENLIGFTGNALNFLGF